MKKKFSNKFFLTLVILIAISSFIFLPVRSAQAQVGFNFSWITGSNPEIKKTITETIWAAIKKAGTISFKTALRSLVNQIAYDTATWVGSGDSGQKPLYYQKPFLPWLADQGKNAAGGFIENFSKQLDETAPNQYMKDLDICSPDLSVSIKLSLGLTDFADQSSGIGESRCTLKKIYERGEEEIALIRKPDYLKNLAMIRFDPSSTDVGAALTLFGEQLGKVQETVKGKEAERKEGEGWLNISELVKGNIIAPPGTPQLKIEQASKLQGDNFFSQTGDIFTDAANIFLNQLALSAFNKLISNLTRNTGSNSTSSNFYAQGNTGGLTQVARQNNTILQARFSERTDYNILSQLSSCPNEANPGPTNCVINQQFVQAIDERLTVSEAIRRGIIDGNKRIGFDEHGNDISYLDGYPYRSLIILRKYTILPVGWEVAAQYIKQHAQETSEITLNSLIDCFTADDSYGYGGAMDDIQWCKGLVDPNWVLKVPKQYCGMEGYGPQILSLLPIPNQKGVCMSTEVNCQTSPASCLNKTDNVECTSDAVCSTDYPHCNLTYSRDIEVNRNDGYCADEQSCIKENKNGSCAFYGYCTEQKRGWVFNQNEDNSCEARNNTCQIYKNETNQQVAFLENTLNYDNCDAGQVGCKQYALTGAYDAATKQIAWSGASNQAYFNKNISFCETSAEGCHQFIRTKDDLDANLLADGSFEQSSCISTGIITKNEEKKKAAFFGGFVKDAYAADEGDCSLATFTHTTLGDNVYRLPNPNNRWFIRVNAGSLNAGIVNTEVDNGSLSLYIEGEGGLFSQDESDGRTPFNLLPNNFRMEPDNYYTLSARVFVKEGTVHAGFGYLAADQVESTARNEWQTLIITFYKSTTSTVNNFYIEGYSGAKFYIDSVKFTKGNAQTSYSDYGSNNVIYEKLMPSYLNNVCYDTSSRFPFTLKADAPDECRKFVKQCAAEEVGCQSYTSVDSGISVTGKVKTADSCPGTCLGYNTFVQQANMFNPKQAAYFIPSTARTCGAQSVGCTAFTNLDKLDEGGEAIEYYSALRQCIKPSATDCLSFYSWEGSDESGYQLKVYSLKKDAESRLGEEPLSTLSRADEALLCNASIFRKLPTESGYNYDCREFYGQDGTVSYHLYEKTISCSEDCHPYRRELSSESACRGGGGTWDSGESRCLYYAIPGEGKICAAANAGCQEYTGNIAGNIRNILSPTVSTFENSDFPDDGWSGGTPSSLSLNLGGNSLSAINISKIVGQRVTRNKSYTISFLARTFTNANVTSVSFVNKDEAEATFDGAGTAVSNEWRLYSFNLSSLNHDVTPIPADGLSREGEVIRIVFSDTVYIDNIKLTEIPNRYYLIKNSWNTPAECDQDVLGAASPGYMLGCSQYRTVDNLRLNLHSFSELCSDSSTGCEAMIDTYNSTDYKAKLVNDTNANGTCDPTEIGCIKTPQDTMINVIYDPAKFCGQENKGCQRMGIGSTYDSEKTFTDIHVTNNPDRYNTTVCKSEAVGCSKWTSPEGDAYFKDPGKEVCEWRLKQGTANNFQWFKKKISRCGGVLTGNVCSTDESCTGSETCQLITADLTCDPVTDTKTIGEGGIANKTLQPSSWAGICDSLQAGCSEYIDPVSKFNPNLISNPGYSPTSETEHVPWIDSGTQAFQRIVLDLNTLYIIKGSSGSSVKVYIKNCTPTDGSDLQLLQLDSVTNDFKVVASTEATGGDESREFFLTSPRGATANCQLWRENRTENQTVKLLKAIVNYQKSQNLDKQSANGLVNYNKGYIMFNERTQKGKTKANLLYNADKTINDEDKVDGVSPQGGPPLNGNTIIKVQADRVCSKWLDCKASIPDPTNSGNQTCLDVGLCDKLNSQGNCAHFITVPTTKNQNVKNLISTGGILNLTGYSKVGYRQDVIDSGGSLVEENVSSIQDFYNLGNMKQVGGNVSLLPNQDSPGDFEKPSDFWTPGSQSKLITILEPQELQNEQLRSIHYIQNSPKTSNYLPPVGRGYGKLIKSLDGGATAIANSKSIELANNRVYVISAYFYIQADSNTSIKGGIKLLTDGGDIELLTTESMPKDQWVLKTIAFKTGSSEIYSLQLFNATDANFYFDNIKIESSLNTRCENKGTEARLCTNLDPENSDTKRPNFVAATCRLFPNSEALDCTQTDKGGVKHKGIKGYCLETDPKNPGTCLLWYPIDKVSSEISTEIPPITFPGGVYYCIDTVDECVGNVPSFYCKKFVKVDTSAYWYQRLAAGSTFKMPGSIPESPTFFTDRKVDFGATAGGSADISVINQSSPEGYFGAYVNTFDINAKKRMSINPDMHIITSYLGYYGNLSRPKCGIGTSRFLGNDGSEGDETSIEDLGKWDLCFARTASHDGGCDINEYNYGDCSAETYLGENPAGIFNRCECWDHSTFHSDHQTSCWLEKIGNDHWRAVNRKESGGSDHTQCTFTCYNRTEKYNVMNASNDPPKVVSRLFPGLKSWEDSFYEWRGSSYGYSDFNHTEVPFPLPGCNGTGVAPRPAIDMVSNADYCYINPVLSQFKIKGESSRVDVNGETELTISYVTTTDAEQLPINEVILDYGFRDGSETKKVTLQRGGGDNNPRSASTVFNYTDIDKGENNDICKPKNGIIGGVQCVNAACCVLKPSLKITDNWEKSTTLPFGGYVVVYEQH
jgi:hypothetical protein